MIICDVCIIGAGPAGLSSAIYLARAGFNVIVLEKLAVGGQINITPHIENYAGVGSVSGYELSQAMAQQAISCGAKIMYEQAVNIAQQDGMQTIELLSDQTISSRSVILAMGAQTKTLGLSGEAELVGSGVSYCATCDGAFFKGKNVIVVGSGKLARQDTEYLSPIVKSVIWVSASQIDDIVAPNVTKLENSSIVKLEGMPLSLVTVKNKRGVTGLKADGLFVAVGYSPANALIKDLVSLDAKGYIVTNDKMQTNIKGVYAVGDLRAKDLRQIVTATSDGAIAAFNISKELKQKIN